MKKRLICLLVLTALLLTGCGQAAPAQEPQMEVPTETPTTEAPTEAPTTEAPTTVPTEPPCEHQWSEATYMTAAVCQLCGEEGAKKPSFFEEHGLNIADYPSPVGYGEDDVLVAEGAMHNKSGTVIEPTAYKIQIFNWRTYPDRQPRENIAYVNAKEGIQEINFSVGPKFLGKICTDKTLLDQFGFNYGFYDYYTGAWLHPPKLAKNGEDIFTYDLVIDDTTYTIECTNTFSRSGGKQEPQEDGSILIRASMTDSYKFSVPMEYDGLVFGILPRRDARGANVNEDGKFVTNLSEEADFEEGVYFRLNLIDRWVVADIIGD